MDMVMNIYELIDDFQHFLRLSRNIYCWNMGTNEGAPFSLRCMRLTHSESKLGSAR